MRNNDEIISVLTNLKEEQNMSLSELARMVGMAKSALSRYFNKTREFPLNKVDVFAKALHTTPEYILGFENENPYNKLKELSQPDLKLISINQSLNRSRQQIVYNFAADQLDQQNSKIHDIDDYRQSHTINVYGSVSAGTGEYLGDGTPEPVTIEGPIPRFDFAVRVHGDSMQPTFDDGQIIFVNKVENADEVRNNQFVIAEINGEAFIKKLFVTADCIKLISLNQKYKSITIHDYDDYRIIGVVVI